MTDCVVNIELTIPSSSGPDVPASGYLEFAPSKRRDLEGEIVLPDKFRVRLDEDGQAQVTLAPTVDGDWAWKITERVQSGRRWYANVPNGPGPVDYDDLVEVDKDTLDPTVEITPVWKQYVDAADALARNADNLTSGTVADARIPSGITRDSELTAAVAAEATARDTAIATAISNLLDGAPGALDTLNELAAAVNDDASFAASVTTALAGKASTADLTTEATNRTNADTALDARLDTLELDTAPGKELGYAERTTSATSTATSVAAATAISGLSVTVTGKGRPVDIEFYCGSITHSVANTNVSVGVLCNGNILGPGTQYGSAAAASTTAGQGRALCIKRRMVLTDGVSYTFTVRAFALSVAGTSTLYAVADYEPLYLAVTAR